MTWYLENSQNHWEFGKFPRFLGIWGIIKIPRHLGNLLFWPFFKLLLLYKLCWLEIMLAKKSENSKFFVFKLCLNIIIFYIQRTLSLALKIWKISLGRDNKRPPKFIIFKHNLKTTKLECNRIGRQHSLKTT